MIIGIAAINDEDNTNFFYGYLGIACALVFASTFFSGLCKKRFRYWISLWNHQERRRRLSYGRTQTRPYNQISGPNRYGRHLGNLRPNYQCYHQSKKYQLFLIRNPQKNHVSQ